MKNNRYALQKHEEEFSCPAEALASLLGKKWVPQIIEQLVDSPKRFGELHHFLPEASPKMLKQQLTLLEDNLLLTNNKTVNGNMVESTYTLSPKGLSLAPIVFQMKEWGQKELICH